MKEVYNLSKTIILQGAKITDRIAHDPNTFVDETSTYAAVVGTLDETGRFIALESRYKPQVGDAVVGVVTDTKHAGYDIEIGMPHEAFLSSREIRIKLQLGEFVVCRVRMVDEVGEVELNEVRRLPMGKLVSFPPAKIPRLIGKKSSMLLLIKEQTGGDIVVGNNGLIWISSKSDIPLVLKAMNLIERKAHFSGLTDEVSAMLNVSKSQEGE